MPTEVNNFVTCPRCGHYCPRNGPHTCPPLAAETFPRGPSSEQTLLAELGQVKAERDKLQVFKTWVHAYLDTHGVPHHPPGTHGAEGCRIGDRMDWLMTKLANAEQAADHIAAEDRAERDALAVTAERMRLALLRLASGKWWATAPWHGYRRIIADALLCTVADLDRDDREALRLAAHLDDDSPATDDH